MACPAWPTCGLAITESERILPQVIERIRALLNRLGLSKEQFVIRMTGCPNGCARPYMAELGFVGSAPNSYQLWLGGTADQTRLTGVHALLSQRRTHLCQRRIHVGLINTQDQIAISVQN